MEVSVKIVWEILNVICVWCDFDSWAPLFYKLSCHLCLVLSDVLVSEEELSVEVSNIYPIQIYYMNILEAAQCKILQNFTSQSSSSND